ncbi:hypothetical protein HME9302_02570 [Alteripontixanthobacter maritimus]|uniref:Uncharacterized protein n=2 Tax=Alteripontixanthobacter maritimus TaxID=2161824 RepID=A0A369QGC7_9SPHN|nr:hypothetical protein HME9302_02570 [Alteripontixanthobacter maritimus]
MGKDANPTRARATVLPLDRKSITIEWQSHPSEDAIARMLLDLLGDDAIKELYNEEGS